MPPVRSAPHYRRSVLKPDGYLSHAVYHFKSVSTNKGVGGGKKPADIHNHALRSSFTAAKLILTGIYYTQPRSIFNAAYNILVGMPSSVKSRIDEIRLEPEHLDLIELIKEHFDIVPSIDLRQNGSKNDKLGLWQSLTKSKIARNVYKFVKAAAVLKLRVSKIKLGYNGRLDEVTFDAIFDYMKNSTCKDDPDVALSDNLVIDIGTGRKTFTMTVKQTGAADLVIEIIDDLPIKFSH